MTSYPKKRKKRKEKKEGKEALRADYKNEARLICRCEKLQYQM